MNSSGLSKLLASGNVRVVPRSFINYFGYQILRFIDTIHGLGAFALITVGVTATKFRSAPHAIRPMVRHQIYESGLRLMPMMTFLAVALGLVIIGQTVSLLQRVGAQQYAGLVMVTVVVRELGPMLTALLVLARVGTTTVIELGTARAMGEIEALESMGIDPIHYLVVPRVIGLATSIFSLTVYGILIALASGYLFIFIQDVPLTPADYIHQIAGALMWGDFVLLALKTVAFGSIIATVTCYQGLARPLRLEQVSTATTNAVVHTVVWCALIDALFIVVYLLMSYGNSER